MFKGVLFMAGNESVIYSNHLCKAVHGKLCAAPLIISDEAEHGTSAQMHKIFINRHIKAT